MSAKANPKTIGAFVVGAAVLLVVGLLVFGSGKIFKQTALMVAFFDESVGGLQVGAPVTLRGVRIGSVKEVRIELDTATLETRTPVYFELERDRIAWIGADFLDPEQFGDLLNKGLRAQLGVQSLVNELHQLAIGRMDALGVADGWKKLGPDLALGWLLATGIVG